MRHKSPAPIISPDGRFEVIIEEDYDRGIYSCNTRLVERATGKTEEIPLGEVAAELSRRVKA